MSTENVTIKFGSDTVTMSWNGAQASAPILVDGEHTGYQTANARHRTAEAVRLAEDKGILGDAWVCVSDLSEAELDLLREVRGHMERT